VECDFTYQNGLASCRRCGRVCRAPAGPVHANCGTYVKPKRAGGPGTELKALLKTIGITAKPNCSCNKRSKVMDEKGCDWCEENLDEIDGWLAEESKKRKLPYLSLAGKTLIRLAIRRARKKGNGH